MWQRCSGWSPLRHVSSQAYQATKQAPSRAYPITDKPPPTLSTLEPWPSPPPPPPRQRPSPSRPCSPVPPPACSSAAAATAASLPSSAPPPPPPPAPRTSTSPSRSPPPPPPRNPNPHPPPRPRSRWCRGSCVGRTASRPCAPRRRRTSSRPLRWRRRRPRRPRRTPAGATRAPPPLPPPSPMPRWGRGRPPPRRRRPSSPRPRGDSTMRISRSTNRSGSPRSLPRQEVVFLSRMILLKCLNWTESIQSKLYYLVTATHQLSECWPDCSFQWPHEGHARSSSSKGRWPSMVLSALHPRYVFFFSFMNDEMLLL